MNRRDYFLACLNVHLSLHVTTYAIAAAVGSPAGRPGMREVADVQSEAWRVPEEAIPMLDPARAALDFYDYHFGSDVAKPPWLHAWEESMGSK